MDLPEFGTTAVELANALALGVVFPWVIALFGLGLAVDLIATGAKWLVRAGGQK